jgi:predicted transcriptional regulator
MTPVETSPDLLLLFKALADQNRLKIVGMLAQEPRAVEDLAAVLRISPSTASHHLAVLGKAGLVKGTVDGYYNIYSLTAEPLTDAARKLLRREHLKRLATETTADTFEQKVLATCTDPDGSITHFPMQEKKFLVLLRYVLRAFEPGVRYTEKQVNTVLKRYNPDTARLRRAFVDYRFMAREGGGGKYWRIDNQGQPQEPQRTAKEKHG